MKRRVEGKIKSSLQALRSEEAAVLALLQERVSREAKAPRLVKSPGPKKAA
jgi:hypothetical protein